jgi:hypothetical protein
MGKQFLGEVGYIQNQPTVVHEDNRGCIFMATENAINQRTKHIDIRHHFIRQAVKEGHIRLKACDKQYMLADCLTKGVPNDKNQYCCQGVGLK